MRDATAQVIEASMMRKIDGDDIDDAMDIALRVMRLIQCPVTGLVMDVRKVVLIKYGVERFVVHEDAWTTELSDRVTSTAPQPVTVIPSGPLWEKITA